MAILQKSFVSGSLWVGSGSSASYSDYDQQGVNNTFRIFKDGQSDKHLTYDLTEGNLILSGSIENHISAPKYSGSGFVFQGTNVAGSTVGGISSGQDLSNKDIKTILNTMLFYKTPNVTTVKFVPYDSPYQYQYGSTMGGSSGDFSRVQVAVSGGQNIVSYTLSTRAGDIEVQDRLTTGYYAITSLQQMILPIGSYRPTVKYLNTKGASNTTNGSYIYIRNYVFAYISTLDYITATQLEIQNDFVSSIAVSGRTTKTLVQTNKYTSPGNPPTIPAGITFKGSDGNTHYLYYAMPSSWTAIATSDTTKLSGGAIGRSLIQDTVTYTSSVNTSTTTEYMIYKIGGSATSTLDRQFQVTG